MPSYEQVQREERGLPEKNTCVSRNKEEYGLDENMKPWENTPSFLGIKEDAQCVEPQTSFFVHTDFACV